MPFHVYGNPCRIDEIKKNADTYNLKLIYDAAHAFGVRIQGKFHTLIMVLCLFSIFMPKKPLIQ